MVDAGGQELLEHLVGPLLAHPAQGGGAEDHAGAVVAGAAEGRGGDHTANLRSAGPGRVTYPPAASSTSSKPSARQRRNSSGSGTAPWSVVTPMLQVPLYDMSVTLADAPMVGPKA